MQLQVAKPQKPLKLWQACMTPTVSKCPFFALRVYHILMHCRTQYLGWGGGAGGLSIHHNPMMHAHHINKVNSALPVPLAMLHNNN